MCISDDLLNFWEKIIKNNMADGGHFEKMTDQKASGCDILCSSSSSNKSLLYVIFRNKWSFK